jgi:hypothetical protein
LATCLPAIPSSGFYLYFEASFPQDFIFSSCYSSAGASECLCLLGWRVGIDPLFFEAASSAGFTLFPGIAKNSVNKTVRETASEKLSDERSEEFFGRSSHEKVFSCFVAAGSVSLLLSLGCCKESK